MCGESSRRPIRHQIIRPMVLAGRRSRAGGKLRTTGNGGMLAKHSHLPASCRRPHLRKASHGLLTVPVVVMASSTVTYIIVEGGGVLNVATLQRPRITPIRLLLILVHAGPLFIATRTALQAAASLAFSSPASEPLRVRRVVAVSRRSSARSRVPMRIDTILVSSISDTAAA